MNQNYMNQLGKLGAITAAAKADREARESLTQIDGIKFDLSAADYFAVDAVSNTGLKWYRKSAAHFKAYRAGLIPNAPTVSQTTGTLTHAQILEGKSDYVIRPEFYPCEPTAKDPRTEKPWHGAAAYCKEWDAKQTAPVISQSEADIIAAGRAAVNFHPLAGPLFCKGRSEVSLFATCPRTGLNLKARLDYLVSPKNEQGYIVDLKTAQDASTRGFKRTIEKYRYHNQTAFYSYVAKLCGLDVTTFYFVALELQPIPMTNVLVLSEFDLELANETLKRVLHEVAECEANNDWPGYCGKTPNVIKNLSDWAHDLEEETIDLEN